MFCHKFSFELGLDLDSLTYFWVHYLLQVLLFTNMPLQLNKIREVLDMKIVISVCLCVCLSVLYQGFMVCLAERGSQWLELRGQELLCTEIILRDSGDVISTWIISVQWHVSVPLDFALLWGMSPHIWPKLDACQMAVP